jgi:hypothetical protein
MSALYLNLGSGSIPLPRYVNVDIAAIPEVDVVHDLDVAPWPWANSTVSVIRAYDIFEHVNEPVLFMQECWRVLQQDGLLDLHVSYWKSENAFTDPTHKRFCTEKTFDYWVAGTDFQARYGAAYGLGGKVQFLKEFCKLDGQELHVQLRKL